MSNNRLVWDGLYELRAKLRRLPTELTQDAASIVRGAVHATASGVQAIYPVGPPRSRTRRGVRLKQGVKVQEQMSSYGIQAIVRSTAKHAHLYEFGTVVRTSRYGNRGVMPAADVFIPHAQTNRARMYQQLIDLLRRAGDFQVTVT